MTKAEEAPWRPARPPLFDGARVRVVAVSDYTAGTGPHSGYRVTTVADGGVALLGDLPRRVSAQGMNTYDYDCEYELKSE